MEKDNITLRTASEIEQWKERLALKAAIPIGIAAAKRHARNAVIEEVAVMLGREYPGNDNTNAFCAAVRSMKVHADQDEPHATDCERRT